MIYIIVMHLFSLVTIRPKFLFYLYNYVFHATKHATFYGEPDVGTRSVHTSANYRTGAI